VITLPPHRLDLSGHLRSHGPLGGLDIGAVAESGLRGRGGGGYPTASKFVAVRGKRRTVIANGCESDPLSAKDHALLTRAPHLVLDGIKAAAQVVGASSAVLCLHEGSAAASSVAAAMAERRDRVRLVEVPASFVSGEESALVHYLGKGDARPTGKSPRPAERGMLVENVDTLAQLALIARHGPAAYREFRTELVTVLGAVRRPGVVEVPATAGLADILAAAGGGSRPLRALLIGGHGGTWVAPDADPPRRGLSSVYALPATESGLAVTADMLAWLATQSARQCGPCEFGLPSVAADFAALARGDRDARGRLARRLPMLTARGACALPDGAARLAASALEVFREEAA